MATGIIAGLSGNASVTYTPATDGQLLLTGQSGSGTASVNGVTVSQFGSSESWTQKMFVGSGVPFTVATSGATISCIVSILEQ